MPASRVDRPPTILPLRNFAFEVDVELGANGFAERVGQRGFRRVRLRGVELPISRARATRTVDAQRGLDDIRARVSAATLRAQSDGVFASVSRVHADGVIATGARQNLIHRIFPLGSVGRFCPATRAF